MSRWAGLVSAPWYKLSDFTGVGDGDAPVVNQTDLQGVDPAVDRQLLPAPPGVTHYGGAVDVDNLLQQVGFAQPIRRYSGFTVRTV